MTGPEHYRTANELLEVAERNSRAVDFADVETATLGVRLIEHTVAQAQVHATLAQTAATISAAAHPGQSQVDYLGEWWRCLA